MIGDAIVSKNRPTSVNVNALSRFLVIFFWRIPPIAIAPNMVAIVTANWTKVFPKIALEVTLRMFWIIIPLAPVKNIEQISRIEEEFRFFILIVFDLLY